MIVTIRERYKTSCDLPKRSEHCSLSREKEEIFVRMLATLEDIAETDPDEGFVAWAQAIARRMVKMARGES